MQHTIFHTNIDCAKGFVRQLPETYQTGYQVGDQIQVFKEKGGELYMKVVGRSWKMDSTLQVELGLSYHFQTISEMEKFITSRGFPRLW